MSERVFPSGPEEVSPEWMTGVLREADVCRNTAVRSVTHKPVGNGLAGDSYRLTLTYDHSEPGAPTSVIGKFPADDPGSRQSSKDHQLYSREVRFYSELAQTLDIYTPRAFAAAHDAETDAFVLILQDLAPARGGNQLDGCSLEDARTAVGEAAALHGSRWADPALQALDWLAVKPKALADHIIAVTPTIVGMFKERYGSRLDGECLSLIEALPFMMAAGRHDQSTPPTIQHLDFRLDNVMFDVEGGARPMATLDWQTLTLGPGVLDVAYFLSNALSPQDRRLHEDDLLRFYHGELIRRGVTGYDWVQCWFDYRRYTFHGIIMGVISAISVEQTARGDALFVKMIQGACGQALDHQTLKLWGG